MPDSSQSPVGDSQANGDIERAIRTVQGQIRTMKSALEANYKVEIGEKHPVMPWLVSYASSLIVSAFLVKSFVFTKPYCVDPRAVHSFEKIPVPDLRSF